MATITEAYVSFETSKLLKEKGFDVSVRYYYQKIDDDITYNIGDFRNWNVHDMWYSMPTLQMAMRWLREVHNIDIIAPPQFDSEKWTYSPIIIKLSFPTTEIRLNDNRIKKEEAVEAAIKYCLEYLI